MHFFLKCSAGRGTNKPNLFVISLSKNWGGGHSNLDFKRGKSSRTVKFNYKTQNVVKRNGSTSIKPGAVFSSCKSQSPKRQLIVLPYHQPLV